MSLDRGLSLVFEGIQSVTSRPAVFIRALAVPVCAYLVVVFFKGMFAEFTLVRVLLSLTSAVLFVIISVTTHRVIITGSESVTSAGIPVPGRREWQFFLASFEIFFYTLPTLIFLLVPLVGPFLLAASASYIVSRLSLIFPSIAIDAPMSSKASWQATKNYQVTMFIVIVLFAVFITGCEFAIDNIIYIPVLSQFISLLASVFLIAALSVAYKKIMTEHSESAST